MTKKQMIIFGSSLLGIALLCAFVVTFFRARNVPAVGDELLTAESTSMEETSSSAVVAIPSQPEASKAYSVPEIKSSAPDVIPDRSSSEADALPAPAVSESSDGSGGVVQTPNWEEQRTLKPGTDLEDAEKEPEYVGTPSKPPVTPPPTTDTGSSAATGTPPATSTPPASSAPPASTGTPKNGDMKTIDGTQYIYVEGFGWVKYGDGNQGTVVDVEITGNKVGH